MRKKMCYFGLLVSAVLVIILFAVPMAKGVSAGLSILFACLFSVSYVQLSYDKMMKTDKEFKREMLDERNILLREKTGNIANSVMMVVLGIVAVVFITMDYLVPAIVVAGILLVQPVILILISNMLEKKM